LTTITPAAKLARAMKFEIQEITKSNQLFPPQIRPLKGGPDKIFVRGNTAALCREPTVAVVGTRKISPYGRAVTRQLVAVWARAGITIVSGLALGTDAAAHEATLDAGGTTVAVLGSGIDDPNITPRTNYRLAQRILEHGGAIISEYAPGTPAQPYHFPARNRIVAGLSQIVVVTEGSMKSGTLITAKCMLEYGRDVFAVPGPITAETSRGPNWLISQGAQPLLRPEDLIEFLQMEPVNFASSCAQANHSSTLPPEAINGVTARQIYSEIQRSPATADDIAERTKLDTVTVLTAISELELAGAIFHAGDTYLPNL
jgi:DNA processing protein